MDRFERLPQEVHASYIEGYLDAVAKVRELDARGESVEHICTALEQSIKTMVTYTSSVHLPDDLSPFPAVTRLLNR